MFARVLLVVVSFVIVVVLLGFFKAGQIKHMQAMGAANVPPPSSVTTVKASTTEWQPVLSAVGSAQALNSVMVTTDLSGIVSEINFQSGTSVKAGDVLVKLDVQAELAQQTSARAQLELARANLSRARNLVKTQVSSASEFDTTTAGYKQAQAAVDEATATISRKTLRAPFDGELGIRQINLGQYVTGGDPVVALESLNPIYVNFSLPQQNLGNLHSGQAVHVTADGFPGQLFEGKITAVDSRVDSATRNVSVQATVQNPDGKLRSGMFLNVNVLLPASEKIIAIPGSAIAYAPYGDSVYIVEQVKGEDGKQFLGVRQQFVQLGAAKGDQIAVISGIKPGEEVVSSGAFKLRNNAPVQVHNEIQPANNPHPTPADS